ncbi:MAG: ACT domain-containing protein [Gemmatimonadetes bacterium]|nr:ACT domain-containing protein [Gemmatimonadota bacterium]
MAIRKQLSVTMENRPGTLARMSSALAEKKVNILALMSMEHGGQSVVRIVVDKLPAAKKALGAIGYAYTEEQVLATKLPNRPGTLAAVAQKLGDAGVNIEYAYYGAEVGSAQVLLLLAVSDFATGGKVVR